MVSAIKDTVSPLQSSGRYEDTSQRVKHQGDDKVRGGR